jgi:hypothetical protein
MRTEQAAYEILVQGWVAERYASWFDGMTLVRGHAEDGTAVTTLCGVVADQAALRGALNQIWDLNLALISVTQIAPDRQGEKGKAG